MRKIIFALSLFIFLFTASAVSDNPAPVYACVNWGTPECLSNNADGSCAQWYTPCLDISQPGTSVCDSGYYSCNRATQDPSGHYQCCPVGTSSGSSGPGECQQWSPVNCPSGSTIDLTELVRTFTGPFGAACGVGTAQVQGSCVETVWLDPSDCHDNCHQEWRCPKGVCSWHDICNTVCDTPGEWSCLHNVYYINEYACMPICSAPAAPTLSSPADGASMASTSVSLVWDSVTFSSGCAGQYKVYVGTTNPPTTLYSTVGSNVTSDIFTGTLGTTYYWYVQAVNGSATADSAVRSFTVLNNQISGTVFYDPNNNCGGSGWSTGGVSVSVNGGAGTAVSGTGTYIVTAAPPGPHDLAVSIPAGFICSTGAGCNTCVRSGIASPSSGSGNNFYLTDSREAWWQTEGAGVYVGGLGGGVTVKSEMPFSSTRLILAGANGGTGALIRGSGSSDLGAGSVSDDLWTTVARYRGKRMDYQYFAAQMGVIPQQPNDWGADTMNKPSVKDFHYLRPQSGTASVSSPWAVASGEKYVVFVNGDLRIDANITVDNGGFLAFIVKGDIIVDPAVTTMQGIFIANDTFTTESVYVLGSVDDVQLNVEGSVITWGSFSLSRNLGITNGTTPAEKFTYRPDLLSNMPDKMKVFAMNWQEVRAGTFGE